MELSELRDFVAVARSGSFVAAANATQTPKSTLSKRVQMLEASLGVRLIERSTRKLRLTPDGEILLERALLLVAEADELERLMRDRNAEPRGRLRVSVPVMLGQEMMGKVAAEFTSRWRDVEIDVVFTDRYSDLIEDYFDCAVRIGPLQDSTLIARRLAGSRTILVVGATHVPDRLELAEPEDCRHLPTISFAPNGTPVPWMLHKGGRNVELSPSSAITLGSLHAIRDAVIAGGGVGLIPALLAAEGLKAGTLVHLLPDWSGPESSVNVVYPSRRHVSARLKAFIDVLYKHMGDGGRMGEDVRLATL